MRKTKKKKDNKMHGNKIHCIITTVLHVHDAIAKCRCIHMYIHVHDSTNYMYMYMILPITCTCTNANVQMHTVHVHEHVLYLQHTSSFSHSNPLSVSRSDLVIRTFLCSANTSCRGPRPHTVSTYMYTCTTQ